MSGAAIALLGAIAGCTIYLGLPIGRIRADLPRLKSGLNAVAIGILLFLVWDVLTQAWEPVDRALGHHQWGPALRDGLVLAAGLCAGLAGLAHYDRWAAARRARTGARSTGPGAAIVTGLSGRGPAAGEIALMIAVGIGLHNFAEGLAIGNSAATGKIQLATLLVIGFGLHNATEGFGIVAPLAAAGERPSWARLLLLGLIGGGPTFIGAVAGQNFVNEIVSVAVLGLAAGSILFVVIELLSVARRTASKQQTAWCVALGMLLGFATDAVVTAAGV
ncbi:MAG: zinc permease [Pseudonocardiales bacterium]|nr:zinc permease [Pseudonocardiales bacterium]